MHRRRRIFDLPHNPTPAIAASPNKVPRRNAVSVKGHEVHYAFHAGPGRMVSCLRFGRCSKWPEHAKSTFHIPGFQTQNSLHGDQKYPCYQFQLETRIVRSWSRSNPRLGSLNPRAHAQRFIRLTGAFCEPAILGPGTEIRTDGRESTRFVPPFPP